MIRKFEVGMKLELVNPINKKNYTVTVTNVPEDKDAKIQITLSSGKVREVAREALKNAVRVKEVKERKPSAISVAVNVLTEANKPMTVSEITAATLEAGYTLPREGKTFANTMSSRLNGAAQKGLILKLANGVFAHKDFDGEYVKPETAAEKNRREKAEQAAKVEQELAEALAE